jgi:vesicle coat complex subunit
MVACVSHHGPRVQVSGTETGVIFGNVFKRTSALVSTPSSSTTSTSTSWTTSRLRLPVDAYRNMWGRFEWENKVAINTNSPTPVPSSTTSSRYQHVVLHAAVLALRRLRFLAANLYALWL